MQPKKINWWKVDFDKTDFLSVSKALESKCVSMGRITEAFENELASKLDVPYVVACSSGSAALLMAMIAAGIKRNDEIILPNRTWVACLNALKLIGALPILVDVNENIPTMDLSAIENSISSKTKAIIPTPLNGRAEDMDKIRYLAKKYNLVIIEDSAQALFSKLNETYMGTQSRFNIFSLGIAKLLPSGQGGFLVAKNKKDAEQLRLIRNNGVKNLVGKNPYQCIGLNFKITDFQSALAKNSLSKLEEKKDKLINLYNMYEKGLKNIRDIKLIPVNVSQGELPLYIEVLVDGREKLVKSLNKVNVETKIFTDSLHKSPLIANAGPFPKSEVFETKGLYLPCGPDQKSQDVLDVLEYLRHLRT